MEESGLPAILAPKDISRVLGISRNQTYQLIHAKNFPAFQIGTLYRVERAKFIKWMDEGGSTLVQCRDRRN